MRPWAIAEDQVKVAASAAPVDVAFSLPEWPPDGLPHVMSVREPAAFTE